MPIIDADLAKAAASLVDEPVDQLPLGELTKPVAVPQAKLRVLLRLAAGRPTAHWRDQRGSVLVHYERAEVTTAIGSVVVELAVESVSGGIETVAVPLAVGRARRDAGMIAATSRRPTGPDAIVERWAEPLVAASWRALVLVAGAVAAAAGRDVRGRPLTPLAIRATKSGLAVVPGARNEPKR